jgi:hypothetical protein
MTQRGFGDSSHSSLKARKAFQNRHVERGPPSLRDCGRLLLPSGNHLLLGLWKPACSLFQYPSIPRHTPR